MNAELLQLMLQMGQTFVILGHDFVEHGPLRRYISRNVTNHIPGCGRTTGIAALLRVGLEVGEPLRPGIVAQASSRANTVDGLRLHRQIGVQNPSADLLPVLRP